MARRKMKNWVAASILFFSLVAIVITGFGTGGFGGLSSLSGGGSPNGNQLATVGGTPVTTEEANAQFNQEYQQVRQEAAQLGQPAPQIAEFLNQDRFEVAVEHLIGVHAMRQYAQARGIVATRGMIDNAISTADDFSDFRINGRFDSNMFEGALQRAGLSLQVVREEFSRRLLEQQLVQPIVAGFGVPQSINQAYATAPLEQRSGLIGVVPVGGIERALHPSEAEIAAYYQRYRRYFTVPERRSIKYALIGPDQVSITAPTEAEIGAVYNNTPRYQAGQIRTLESVNFGMAGSAQTDAAAFAQRVRGGASFQQSAQAAGRGDAYARRASQTQRDFANLVTPPIAAQAFSAQQGAIIGPVRSQLGWLVIRVETAAPGTPLAAVRAAIIRELERRKRTAAISAMATQLEQQLEEGASFEDAANGAHLTVVTSPPITAQGRLSSGPAWPGMSADVRNVVAAGFEIDGDRPQPVVAALPDNQRYALIGVERTEAAAPPPLAEIHDLVRGQLVHRTALRQARQIADAIAARINAGMAPAQAFAQAGMPLPPPAPINTHRANIMTQQQVPESLRLFFRLRPGTAGVVAAPNSGGWMIAAPQQSLRGSNPSPRDIASAQAQLGRFAQEEARSLLVKAMERNAGVQRNPAAVRAERQRITATMISGPQQ